NNKEDLDDKNDDDQRRHIETNLEALHSRRAGGDSRLEGKLAPACVLVRSRREDEGEPHHRCGNDQRENRVDQERQPVVEHASLPLGDDEPNRFPSNATKHGENRSTVPETCVTNCPFRSTLGTAHVATIRTRWSSRKESCP